MVTTIHRWIVAVATGFAATSAFAQQVGSIRGSVYDKEFDAPLPLAQVTISDTGVRVVADEEGNFVLPDVPPGSYTLVFSKEGYARQLRANVVVTAGTLTEVDAALSGDFAEMDEVVAQDVQMRAGTESALLKLRFDNLALLDSIGADFIRRSGASDAAAALRLVSGASTQDGKFAVIRGLPDRYVSSQLNGVRLPSADEDTRAVDLELFPAAVIESIQVSKAFTPDQQGDASGGAVNVVLKSIPEESIFQIQGQYGYNSQVGNRKDFLTYQGGGVNFWGKDDGSRDIQTENIGKSWTGAVGVSEGDAPPIYKWSVNAGGSHEFDDGFRIGGFTSFFYERDAEYFDNGVDNSLWVVNPGKGLVPQTNQGTPEDGNFRTSLYDVTQGSELVRWGWLGTAGIEFEEKQAISVTYLYTRIAEDVATLAQDTAGKDYFFPGYNPNDPSAPGNTPQDRFAAPWLRTETLDYTERTQQTLMFKGAHDLPTGEFGDEDVMLFSDPQLDWTIAGSSASLNQPDKRQFGSIFVPESLSPGFPPFVPPFTLPEEQLQYKPDANFTLGNLQRTFEEIEEDSTQGFVNLKLPFTQWTDSEGFFKFGGFYDKVDRTFTQNTFSNFNDNNSQYSAPFNQFWSAAFPSEDHPITAGPPFVDVDYDGAQRIAAGYGMLDLPLTPWLNVVGGARYETTNLTTTIFPEADATWFPPGAITPIKLNPGDADASLDQGDWLPSIGLVWSPVEQLKVRAWYSETIARPVFKELTPVLQQEFLGGDIFIGNPDLMISSLQNYDLRIDYEPYEGALLSASYFYKSIEDPIENVQRLADFSYTTPVNYPSGRLSGFEFEVRQDLGHFWEPLRGLTLGGNATFIESSVTLPAAEAAEFASIAIQAPMTSRDMTDAPEYLYNLFCTYESSFTGTGVGLFYTVTGDRLIAGAGVSEGNFVPNVYATEFGTLNITASQKIGEHIRIFVQAKNLTNPDIETVYRSSTINGDVLRSSFSLGIDLAIGISATFTF